jgi:phosphopantetheine--protein transferase-like protein
MRPHPAPEEMLPLLPPMQQQRYLCFNSSKRRREYLHSRLLICTALSRHYQHPSTSWIIEEPENSAPIIHNLPAGSHISLSHSHDLICFALSPLKVGVDIERVRPRRNFIAMAQLFMNNSELKQLPSPQPQQQQYFYHLWCAKEALYKALPRSEQSETTLKKLPYLQLKSGQLGWQLAEFELEGYQAAIVNKKNARKAVITKHFIDLATLQAHSVTN